jgi:ATP-dependent DNA ligase
MTFEKANVAVGVQVAERRIIAALRHQTFFRLEDRIDPASECVWLRPEAVAQVEFLDWTAGDWLRHSKFVGLREDKDARSVVKEQP